MKVKLGVKIKLGDRVMDTITGFGGRVIARIEYLNGCVSFEVQPMMLNKDVNMPKAEWIDENQLILVEEKQK